MQSAFVIAIVLSGIGCHNKCSDATNAAPLLGEVVSIDVGPFPARHSAPINYGWSSVTSGGYDSSACSNHQAVWRSTLWSFVLGRDPGMPTAREIEESVFGPSPGH